MYVSRIRRMSTGVFIMLYTALVLFNNLLPMPLFITFCGVFIQVGPLPI